jgi:asparagine synthase (glutamine-hydrolysing)
MCGIAGIYSLASGRLPPVSVVDAMCRAIMHRGPDDQGIYNDDRAIIGMRRLSIIDLASGHQPIHNEDQSVWLVFNGEIYNYRELRRDLEARGHSFYTHSDSECIVHCYEEYGTECFSKLVGMFAIAIWDKRHQRLVLARDRVGKKPLFYTTTRDGLFAFGSEIKTLLVVPGVETKIAPEAVWDYLLLGYVPTPRSIFSSIAKLPPAHYMVCQDGAVTTHSYWQLDFEPKWNADEPELVQRLQAELETAVRARLVSDVPFGAFLSGGLDSSVVAALMARNLGTPVKTFTIGFQETIYDETVDARRVARHIDAEHHELIVDPDAVSLLDDLVWYFDEPFGDSSAIPTYLVSKLAAQHVKMVLSGDGGDESFAGYTRYAKYRLLGNLHGAAGLARRGFGLLAKLLPAAASRRAAWIAYRLGQPYPDNYLTGVALMTPEAAQALIGGAPRARTAYGSVAHHFERSDISSGLDKILAGDMATYLLDDILVKVDRMTMANSIEARAPLLDHRLMEFAARVPDGLKTRHGKGKYLFRKAAAGLLPAECLQKKKQGFAIPLALWFRGELQPLMRDLLASRAFRERGIFNPAVASGLLERHVAGQGDFSEPLWLILVFELWARRFSDQPAAVHLGQGLGTVRVHS